MLLALSAVEVIIGLCLPETWGIGAQGLSRWLPYSWEQPGEVLKDQPILMAVLWCFSAPAGRTVLECLNLCHLLCMNLLKFQTGIQLSVLTGYSNTNHLPWVCHFSKHFTCMVSFILASNPMKLLSPFYRFNDAISFFVHIRITQRAGQVDFCAAPNFLIQ